jgi:hypothetical protein
MIKKEIREILYFLLAFLMFYLCVKLKDWTYKTSGISNDIAIISCGILFSIILIFLFYITKINSNEGFWDISPPALCKGGPYFWQGDSPISKMCREMASTPEGRIAISGYNCPTGYVGQPGLPFYYTPISNDNWENERCEDKPTCKGVDVGLCSFEKQV